MPKITPVETATVVSSQIKRACVGHRFEYDEDAADIFLQSRILNNDLLDEQQRNHFNNTITSPNRVKIRLSPSRLEYSGTWYYQGLEPTCTPWAIVNAMHSLGVEPISAFVAELLNTAIDIEDSEKSGMGYHTAKEILESKYPNQGIDINELDRDERLERMFDPSHLNNSHSRFAPFLRMYHDSQDIQKDQANAREITQNSKNIKSTLDSGGKILAVVTEKDYSDEGDGLHAISIVGYRISEEQFMDIQVIDADRGILWMSLEHLLQCVWPFNTYKISKKS